MKYIYIVLNKCHDFMVQLGLLDLPLFCHGQGDPYAGICISLQVSSQSQTIPRASAAAHFVSKVNGLGFASCLDVGTG